MKISLKQLFVCLLLPATFNLSAATHYVALNSTSPVTPYTSWATATTNLQLAIDVAASGDLVLVSNGVYQTGGRLVPGDNTTNRIVLTNWITVQSVNGPAVTTIVGHQVPGTTNGNSAVRCVYLGTNATLIGFTLTNGATLTNPVLYGFGGGVRCIGYSSILSNCVITGCSAVQGAGAAAGTLINCTLANNVATETGGGTFGGVSSNCLFIGNSAPTGGGASFTIAISNVMNNCTIAGNSSSASGGGIFVKGVTAPTLVGVTNCIIISNSAPMFPNYYDYADMFATEIKFNHCCTTPSAPNGANNFTNDPLFLDAVNGNYRLQSNSPCINAGNNSIITSAADLDGNPRIAGGTVDLGAYELPAPASVLSYVLAQQYGLPTDGSADYADADGDGMNNWQEWRAGTNPTNAASVLTMFSATPNTNGGSGVMVTWQSVANVNYFIQRSTNLAGAPAFSTIASNVFGPLGTNSYTDSAAANGGVFFYRVGVQ